jgi:uracil-DNA glycosylase family 4
MSDPTRFDLDERQRAILAEMGVRVWWPQSTTGDAPATNEQNSATPRPVQAAPSGIAAAPLNPAVPLNPATPAIPSTPAPTALPTIQRPAPVVAAKANAPMTPVTPPASVPVAQPLAEGVDRMSWPELQSAIETCQACTLCSHRQKSVVGVGDLQADWMVIGDPVPEAEGQHGEPFVGPAQQLLNNMLKAVGLSREATGASGVYITSSLKCRLPANRNPSAQELVTCEPYLARQVALVQPKVIVLMGRFSMQSLLQTQEPLGKLRGQVHRYRGVPVVVTYHPETLLRSAPDKAKAWADLVPALQTVQG